ncbi:MAG: dihydropyrimidinase [Calditrichaceae bacterium]|nr:dihydropyrimidinase [Calditrichaceae bacterium]
MSKILIKNGNLVTPQENIKADILIGDAKIEKIESKIDAPNAEIYDASGKLIFPGFIDAHTHMGIPIRHTFSADNFESGSMAALHGGVTTIIDFTVQDKGESLLKSIERRRKLADEKISVDYALHCNVTDLNEHTVNEIPEVIKQGIISFKAFTAYKEAGMQLDDEQILDLLWHVNIAGGMVMFHAENGGLISFLTKKFIQHGKTDAQFHPNSRPPEAEIEAVWRLITLNQSINCPIYFVHLTTAEAVQIIAAARERNQYVYAETCPQYLFFNKNDYKKNNGHRLIAAPPFRNPDDNIFLWQALQQGMINVVGTDHCPFTIQQKEMGQRRFDLTPNGIPGVETLFYLLYSEGVKKERLSLQRLVSLIAEEPARLFGLYPQKGTLIKGADADLVMVDPDTKWKISVDKMHSDIDWTPYDGLEINGKIKSVVLRGKWLLKDGKVVTENLKQGQFVPAPV